MHIESCIVTCSFLIQIQQVLKEIYGDNFIFLLVKANAGDVQRVRHIRAAKAQEKVFKVETSVS